MFDSENDVSFKYWNRLPFKLRQVIIDKLDTKSKVKLACCSKFYYKLITNSKSFVYGIKWIATHSESQIILLNSSGNPDYFLEIANYGENQSTVITFAYDSNMIKSKEVFKMLTVEDGNMMTVSVRYLVKYLEKYRDILKSIHISVHDHSFKEFNLRNMTKLENIEILRPNENIDLIDCGFITLNQIFNAKKTVILPGTKINLERLLQIKARSILIDFVALTEQDINAYLKLWKNGELHDDFRYLHINCCNSSRNLNFNVVKQGLDISETEVWSRTKETLYNLKDKNNVLADIEFINRLYFSLDLRKYKR